MIYQNLLPKIGSGVVALGVLTGVGISALPAQAFQIFFGEDLGQGESIRLPSTPNANAAQSQFLGKLNNVGTEDFEGAPHPPGQTTPFTVTFPGSFATTITATLSDNGTVFSQPTGTNGFGRYPTSGNQYVGTGSHLHVNFDTNVAAFGFKGVDIGDFGGQVTLNLKKAGALVQKLTIPNTINGLGGGVLFYGVISDGPSELFDEVEFSNTAPGVDFFGFDDMTVGDLQQVQPTPEPTNLLGLIALGTLGAASTLKRQLKPSKSTEKEITKVG